MSTTDHVHQYVEKRRSDPDWNPQLEALAASAHRLAELLDEDQNGSSAANIGRELRLTITALAPPEETEPAGPSALDEIIQRRRERLTDGGAA